MNFKDLKIGQTLFLFDKNTMSVKKSAITHVTSAHVESQANSLTQLVVDITVNTDGKPVTYVVPDTAVISYCGNTMISSDKDCIINEIKSMKVQNEQIVASVDKCKEIIGQCDNLISELDDAFREKKENDERLNKLESMMQTLLDKLG